MNYEELLEMLELDSPEEFEYFENLADIFECEEDIEEEALAALLRGVDYNTLYDILGKYFEDMLDKLPDEYIDLYTLINTIGTALMGLAGELANGDEDNDNIVSSLAEEMNRFHRWYMLDSECTIKNLTLDSVEFVVVSEALVQYRMRSLTGYELEFDFSGCLDYPIDEYVMQFSDIAAREYSDYDDEEEHEHHHHHHHDDNDEDETEHVHSDFSFSHKYSDAILDEGFVYDDVNPSDLEFNPKKLN